MSADESSIPNGPKPEATQKAPNSGAGSKPGNVTGLGKQKWGMLGKDMPVTPVRNGSLKRSGSLVVPGGKGKEADDKGDGKDTSSLQSDRSQSLGSTRRGSHLSIGSQLSGLDLSKLQAQAQQNTTEESGDKSKNTQLTNDSYLRAAIPYLPRWMAIICLIMNIFIPGSG